MGDSVTRACSSMVRGHSPDSRSPRRERATVLGPTIRSCDATRYPRTRRRHSIRTRSPAQRAPRPGGGEPPRVLLMLAARCLSVLVALDAQRGGARRRAVTAAGVVLTNAHRQSPARPSGWQHRGATAATVDRRIRRTILTLHEPADASIATAHSQRESRFRVLSTVVRYPETRAPTQ